MGLAQAHPNNTHTSTYMLHYAAMILAGGWLVKNLGQAENIGDDKITSHNTLTNRSAGLLHNDSSSFTTEILATYTP